MRELWPWLVGVIVVVGIVWFGVTRAGQRDSAEAHRLVEQGAVLLDVRTPGEYAGGHLDGAVNIPVDQLAKRIRDVGPTDRPVVVYCHSGGRSAAAADLLRRAGYTKVEDLGAMRNW